MNKKRAVIAVLIMTVCFSFCAVEPVSAASAKKPAAPKIISASVKGTSVTLRWKKARNAVKYQVAVRSSRKGWVKYKTVSRTKKNKKRYTKANKYKVKAKGRKYTVYKYAYKYTVKKTVSKKKAKLTGLKSNTEYTFAVRSVNGKRYSAWKTISRKTGAHSEWIKLNGQSIKVTEGQLITLPLPVLDGISIDKKSIDIIPEKDDYYDFQNDDHIRVPGKDKYGFSAHYVYYPGIRFLFVRRLYSREGMVKYGQFSYGSSSIGGPVRFHIRINNDDVKAVWTLDGTEPQLGQEDKLVEASEYPFGKLPNDSPIMIRNSWEGNGDKYVSVGGKGTIGNVSVAIWGKLYYKDTLIEEYIIIEK